MDSIAHFKGSDKIIKALGFWPSFHDAEVISFSAERALPVKIGATLAKLVVHVRQYTVTGEGTAEYQLSLQKSILISLVFFGVCDLELSEFNHQNVIDSINVTQNKTTAEANLEVCIKSIWGFGGVLRCSSISVESVQELAIAQA